MALAALASGAPALPVAAGSAPNPASRPDLLQIGQRIYRDGILPSGAALHGERVSGIGVDGQAAACATCHRRSGFGTSEGVSVIPPITGEYLFRPGGRLEDIDLRYMPGFQPGRKAYDEDGVKRAIREGIGRHGQALDYLMPRFGLDDQAMAALLAYLKQLSREPFPGTTPETLHFATIVTPDTDPARRRAMLEVMQRFIEDKNQYLKGGGRALKSDRGVQYRVKRAWALHVWELSGAAQTWEAQLDRHLAAQPVFAAISGLGGKNWAPVHRFCERVALPCILPNVDLPAAWADHDFYTIYFSRGVLLEAGLIAQRLIDDAAASSQRRMVQIARQDDIGADAATALKAMKATTDLRSQLRLVVTERPESELAQALSDVRAGDVLVLWLRAGDLKALPETPPAGVTVFVSGILGGLEDTPLPSGWRKSAHLTYPFDLPDQRRVRMNFPLGWFRLRGIPVVDERLQSDTYVAMGIVSEMVGEMLESFVPEYLVERTQDMISRRLVNGYYPRLALAQDQRFGSKGGFLVHFRDLTGTPIEPEGGWIVPDVFGQEASEAQAAASGAPPRNSNP
jgi:mono/diheme cytochrome c family protein